MNENGCVRKNLNLVVGGCGFFLISRVRSGGGKIRPRPVVMPNFNHHLWSPSLTIATITNHPSPTTATIIDHPPLIIVTTTSHPPLTIATTIYDHRLHPSPTSNHHRPPISHHLPPLWSLVMLWPISNY